ncbi:MSMEG_0567/sll0787 family protein [Streptomyces olivaceus]|uniref:MSMEG_0567/sll0787 family protein n=1 Tax=Streptomyces olivaceus TaxID=47716 RepID=UPI0036594A6F
MYLDEPVPALVPGEAADILALLGDRSTLARRSPAFRVGEAEGPADMRAYHGLRREAFVAEQRLFTGHDLDDRDTDARTRVLVARDAAGTVVGGVRLGPAAEGPDIGWWQGGRLVVARAARGPAGIGAALVRAACARAEAEGALRFDATVQSRNAPLFLRLGWQRVRDVTVAGAPHVLMRWPIGRIAAQATAAKAALGPLLAPLTTASPGFVGDDGAPVPGTEVIAACDAIVPSMVERDPAWAGWCAVLVNANDLAAMGAAPLGLLDALGAPDAAHATRVLDGLRRAAQAYGLPVLGGHAQLGVPAALSVTALGRTPRPVPGGGGRPGHAVRLTADLGGGWRPGYRGVQWDSTSRRSGEELRAMTGAVAAAAPAAAKDVSMAGAAGTLGMLAEASGCRALLDVAAVPRPKEAAMGDWLTCFPGYAMLTADEPGAPPPAAGPATSAVCGELTEGEGVGLRWPDGDITEAVPSTVTGMGAA